MYKTYPSTFDKILSDLKRVKSRDPAAVEAAAVRLEKQLAERVREEVDGTGDLAVDLAYRRILPTLSEAVDLRAAAARKGTPEPFLALVDRLIEAMEEALRIAPQPDGSKEPGPEPDPIVLDLEPVDEWARPPKARIVEIDPDDL